MPTYESEARFLAEFLALDEADRRLFSAAVRLMVADLKAGRPFRKGLRVRGVQGHTGVYEMTWSWPNGRATFPFGPAQRSGEAHVMWQRIGGHEIFRDP